MCFYCTQAKKNNLHVFDCRLKVALDGIHYQMERPNYRPQSSNQMKIRADSLRSMANGVILTAGKVKEEYDYAG